MFILYAKYWSFRMYKMKDVYVNEALVYTWPFVMHKNVMRTNVGIILLAHYLLLCDMSSL